MAESTGEVLYEMLYHAIGGGHLSTSSSLWPLSEQSDRGGIGQLMSFFPLRGIHQIKEKWNEYKRPKTLKKRRSLFISPNGEHVAVAFENQVTILQNEDNFMKPCGTFTGDGRHIIFKCGAWLGTQGILVIVDDVDNFYLVKSNGQEVSRITSKQLGLPFPIVDLTVLDDLSANPSFLCDFDVITTDGSLHHIDVSDVPSVHSYSCTNTNSQLKLKGPLSQSISCVDFCRDLSLIAMVGAAVGSSKNSVDGYGFYSLYIWRIIRNFEIELVLCNSSLEGLFSVPKVYSGSLKTPKVAISSHGKYVGILDMTGTLGIYSLCCDTSSLTLISFYKQEYSDSPDLEGWKFLKDVYDFTWWSDHILIFATRNGTVTMLDVRSGKMFLKSEPVLCKPLIERCKFRQGYVFAVESISNGTALLSEHKETTLTQHENTEYLDSVKLCWRVISFSEKSVEEMYELLIQQQQFQSCLDFAYRFGLNKDEIFKARWLHSCHGVDEVKLFLSEIKNEDFVLSECVDRIGSTENATVALFSLGIAITDKYKFSNMEEDDQDSKAWKCRMIRLQLLQCRDRLDTFLGINMGRFSLQEYGKFRVLPLKESAIALAECGKIGALNLLFKRHPYSLASDRLDILAAIPETVPVQSYGQLLPGRSPPSTITLRDEDWVECKQMVAFIDEMPSHFETSIEPRTEIILKQTLSIVWPSVADLSEWYKNRARDIDLLSGQLDNCVFLIDFAFQKGIIELQQFLEDIRYLHQLIYSIDEERDFTMSLTSWEQLSDYEKFKTMLKNVKEDTVVAHLQANAIPFMHKRSYSADSGYTESFLVRWLKELSAENHMDVCLAVVDEGCKDLQVGGIFRNETEAVETALDCLYLCTLTDCWNTMASILSKLPRRTRKEMLSTPGNDSSPRLGIQGFGSPRTYWNNQSNSSKMQMDILNRGNQFPQNVEEYYNRTTVGLHENLDKMIRVAEGHVEVGRLLAYYQVPKPVRFFREAHLDEKNIRQLLRLVLSKFSRRQPGRTDSDWANMWRDLQSFQEKAFLFLDKEYLLVEFCRGLLKAGKFSLARNYLKGTGTIALSAEKTENIIIQAAREYFFSASSLVCSEIWKAQECLKLFPNSDNVKAESDLIDAITTRLPNLGVTLLPLQFKQIRNPMEIINMVIRSQSSAYLDVDELIEIAQLLGLKSQDEISSVQEAVAREAAVAGDIQLAFDLCLILAKKGHGSIWDLASAIARGPALDNMDLISQRQLLGFALSHCDDESIGDLLQAWKGIDLQIQNEKVITLAETCSKFPTQDSIISPTVKDFEEMHALGVPQRDPNSASRNVDQEVDIENIKNMFSSIIMNSPGEDDAGWDHILRETGKESPFIASKLPQLLELINKVKYGKKTSLTDNTTGKWSMSLKMQAGLCLLSWLSANDFAPSDDLIASLAKSAMEPPISEDDDILGCIFLLNLVNALHGKKIIEEQLTTRKGYQEVYNIMNLGMIYSSLQNSAIECSSPCQRKMLLLHKFQQKHTSLNTDEMTKINEMQSTFWREWKLKLEEQRRLADQARELEHVIPWAEASRFLSGDVEYIEDTILSFIDSVESEKKHIVLEAVKLADKYGLARAKVLLRYLGSALVSEHWTNDEILSEISDFREDVVGSSGQIISLICSVVYPKIEGCNKQRLSYVYGYLSSCYFYLKKTGGSIQQHLEYVHTLEAFQFYKILEQESMRVMFIKDLNFKRITGLNDLNFESFNAEVLAHVCEPTVDTLADMVKNLVGIYKDPQALGLINSQSVYKHHILNTLADFEAESRIILHNANPDNFLAFMGELEKNYRSCNIYFKYLMKEDVIFMLGMYYRLCVPDNPPLDTPNGSASKAAFLRLLGFWIKLADEAQSIFSSELLDVTSNNYAACSLAKTLNAFMKMVVRDEVSVDQAWGTILGYAKLRCADDLKLDGLTFCKAMVFSGCSFEGISEVISEGKPINTTLNVSQYLLQLYENAADSVLKNLVIGSENHQNLHQLLLSLSQQRGNHLENLMVVRRGIWEILAAFSEDMQMPSSLRVYSLELMQSITGKNIHSFCDDHLSAIQQWEGWEEPYISRNIEREDAPSKLASTLIALKSTELAATISPILKVTSNDLTTIESEISCFLNLSLAAISKEHIYTLKAILEEWEVLHTTHADEQEAVQLKEERTEWSGGEWDEGWEDVPDDLVKEEAKTGGSTSIHPLHSCWMEITRRLVEVSEIAYLNELMDRSLSKSEFILLSESEAQELLHLLVSKDCFFGLRTVLLLPYEALWFQSMGLLEEKLKQKGSYIKTGNEHELLMLILSSGLVPSIASDPSYCNVFSYLCYLVGLLSHKSQEDIIRYRRDRSSAITVTSILFCSLLFPCFASELVIAGQYVLAGYIISKWMHTHTTFSSINAVEVNLRKYLERHLHKRQSSSSDITELASCGSLQFTCSNLRKKLGNLLESSLSSLQSNMK